MARPTSKCPPRSAVSDPTPPATTTAHQPPLPLLLHGVHRSPGLLLGADDFFIQKGMVVPGLPSCPPSRAPRPLCSHRVLGCTPFLTVAYFLLWFLPPFTSLRGLWYTGCYCLFQALATVSRWPCCWSVATGRCCVEGRGQVAPRDPLPAAAHPSRPPPPTLGLGGIRGDMPAGSSGLGRGGGGGAQPEPGPGARSSSRCPTRRSPCS